MHRRLQIALTATNETKAKNLVDAVKTRVLATDKWTGEDAVYKKNLDIDYGKGISINPNIFWIRATYLFLNATKAQTVFDYIKGNMPTGIKGLVSLHFCPEEGEIKEGWLGCKDDPRAEYKEVSF